MKKQNFAEKVMSKHFQDFANKKRHLQPFISKQVLEAWQAGYIKAMNVVAEFEELKSQVEAQGLEDSGSAKLDSEKE